MTDLIDLLVNPEVCAGLNSVEWNTILPMAQRTQVIGQWGRQALRCGLDADLPSAVQHRVDLAILTSQRRADAVQWELQGIRRAVPKEIPLVVLKGAAHVLANDDCGQGRIFSDIDIMVPRDHLDAAESALVACGWQPGATSAYDARYYREWMHELPPMMHVRRRTVLDLHHSILPVISPYRLDPQLLFEVAKPVWDGVFVLDALDRIVHCAVHLVVEGDVEKILRGAYDLHMLLKQHVEGTGGQTRLLSRAVDLGVMPLVKHALSAAEILFNAQSQASAIGTTALARHLVVAARANADASIHMPLLTRLVIVIAAHRAKMPLSVLLPHLLRKSIVGKNAGKAA